MLLNSFQVFDIINVMTGGGPLEASTTIMVYQVYQETFVNSRTGYGAAVATIMFLAVFPDFADKHSSTRLAQESRWV